MHLKRLRAPRFWKVPKKVKKWVVSPRLGPHKKFECIPLLILVRDILKLAETGKEAKSIIKNGEILVDEKARKDHKYPVGLMDVIRIPKIKKVYRIVSAKEGLKIIEIPKKESSLKLCKVKDKTVVKGGLTQLNLHDGRNILVKKDEYKTGDSILIEVPSQKIIKRIKMEKDSLAMITGGQNRGTIAKIKEIIITRSREPNKVICKKDSEEFVTIKDYVFVVGKEKPVIKVI
jgi:small subunit ribosomal protein S4e